MSVLTEFLEPSKDARVKDWFLVSSPFYSIIGSLIYIIIVKIIGPKLMETRKPYEFKNILFIYNAFQVAVSTFLFYESIQAGWLSDFSWICQPVDYSTSPRAIRTAVLVHWFYLSRYFELLDTFFFVLRKKYNQVTFLHVSHHGIMPYFSWIAVKAGAGGSSTFPIFLNSFVHIVMYTYYLLAGMGPEVQKYLWWKKYITAMQLIQFVIIFIHNVTSVFSSTCNFPKIISVVYISATIYFFVLFYLFYQSQYKKKLHPKKNDESTETKTQRSMIDASKKVLS